METKIFTTPLAGHSTDDFEKDLRCGLPWKICSEIPDCEIGQPQALKQRTLTPVVHGPLGGSWITWGSEESSDFFSSEPYKYCFFFFFIYRNSTNYPRTRNKFFFFQGSVAILYIVKVSTTRIRLKIPTLKDGEEDTSWYTFQKLP